MIADAGAEHERRMELFGTRVRVLVGDPLSEGLPSPQAVALQIEGLLRSMHARLTRFQPDSELASLNDCAGESFEASGLLLAAVDASLWAARRSGGLVDPTLIDELEDAGYRRSRVDAEPAPLSAALACAPPRRPAAPRPSSDWRRIVADPERGIVVRPPGVRLDLGGVGKGFAADLASERLAGYASHVIDAGGDLRIGGERPLPRPVSIAHPLGDRVAHEFELERGSVATSGIATRIWRTDAGYSHHILDPSTGRPAWTGMLQATAVAPTALEAEVLAKMAFLAGPSGAAEVLREHGGLTVAEDGSVEQFGPLAAARPARLGAAA
jgi:thiamine biosynthesis lipoprotein